MIGLEVGLKLAASVKEGAEILIGGKQIENRGYLHRPTILKNVTPKMHIAQEEVFDPVIAPIVVSGGELGSYKAC